MMLTNSKNQSDNKESFKALAILICLMSFQIISAQSNWRLEFRPNISFPTQKIENIKIKTGFGFELTIAYRFIPNLYAYTGWGWNQFSSDELLIDDNADLEETGYTFGLQFINSISNTKLSYLLKVGIIYNHLEIEGNNGDIVADSDHGIGFQIGAGLEIPIDERFSFTPTVRYRSLSRELNIEGNSIEADLTYLSFGGGIVWSF